MALLGFEGFDCESLSGPASVQGLALKPFGAAGVWTIVPSTGIRLAGLLGGFALEASNTGGDLSVALPSTYATLIAGFRYRTHSNFAAVTDVFKWKDGATVQCGISINTAGKLIFWRGTNATILATGTTTLSALSWYFLEIKTTFHNTTGTIDVKIGGVSELSLTGQNTRNSANNQGTGFAIVLVTNGSIAFDDLYCCDTS